MKRKSLWKVFGAGMLAFSLLLSPIAGAGAQAAGEDGEGTADSVKEGGSVKDIDPTRDKEIPAVGEEGDENYKPAKAAYSDTDIPVWGHTKDAVVYSVDVEWGAMTFQWENSSWDVTLS